LQHIKDLSKFESIVSLAATFCC